MWNFPPFFLTGSLTQKVLPKEQNDKKLIHLIYKLTFSQYNENASNNILLYGDSMVSPIYCLLLRIAHAFYYLSTNIKSKARLKQI